MGRSFLATCLGFSSVAFLQCQAVPSISFEDDDRPTFDQRAVSESDASDLGERDNDATVNGNEPNEPEPSAPDASVNPPRDASPDTRSPPAPSCPASPPPGATACCGTMPCYGDCSAVTCSACVSECQGKALCCARTGHKPNCKKSLAEKCPKDPGD